MVSEQSTRFRLDGASSTESKVALMEANSSFASTRNFSSSSQASLYDWSECEAFLSRLRYQRGERAWPDVSHNS